MPLMELQLSNFYMFDICSSESKISWREKLVNVQACKQVEVPC